MAGLNSTLAPASTEPDIQQQNRKIFQIYNLYRLVLAVILLISFHFSTPASPLGSVNPRLFEKLAYIYLVVNVLSLVLPALLGKGDRPQPRYVLGFAILIVDIILLTLLSYTCGGVSSGMAHLLLVPISAGSMIFGTRLGIFYASVGAIAVIYSESYLYFTVPGSPNNYVQAGLLGLLLFVSSLVLQYLGHRIRQKELINRQQAASIQSLQEMNQQIIQRMQTGIVVTNKAGQILNCNSSARRLLAATDTDDDGLQRLPAQLASELEAWLANPEHRSEPFRSAPDSVEILANFSFLQRAEDPNILIFLEDYSQLSSRAQHLKLMSLGRLSASIAHEIRNPLGAISHACQLLNESEHMDADDKRLLSIVNSHTQRVNTIIENVLEHSRPRQQAPELFRLAPWLDAFMTRFRNSYSQPVDSEATLDDPELTIRFNQSQLEQLLTNLCDNALRYSEKHAGRRWVRVHAYSHPQLQGPVVEVVDLGPGVRDADVEQVFEPFFTTETRGTGLGLFICKEICEANQASIFFSRTNDGHSSFRIQFAHPDRNIT